MIRRSLPAVLLALLVGCSSSSGTSAGNGDGAGGATGTGGGGGGASGNGAGGDAGTGGAVGTGGAGGGLVGSTGGASGTSSGGSGPTIPAIVYAHTDTTLYTLDPTAPMLDLTTIGDFDCVPSQTTAMTDFAVNAAGDLWGVSAHAVWKLAIQGTKVACVQKISLADPNVRFYALTFAPAGVLGDTEVLVAGNTAGELWSIDGAGKVTQRGTFGVVPANDGNGHTYANAGKAWELSGDMVFLANNGKPVGFATVRDCPSPPDTAGCNNLNTLIEIDVPKLATATTDPVTKAVRGQIVTAASCSDGMNGYYGNMYGIASWNDALYGFSRSGNLVKVSLTDGAGCLVKAYPTRLFAGAGVSTLAPIIPPVPKLALLCQMGRMGEPPRRQGRQEQQE